MSMRDAYTRILPTNFRKPAIKLNRINYEYFYVIKKLIQKFTIYQIGEIKL